jgi:hypothetical protein
MNKVARLKERENRIHNLNSLVVQNLGTQLAQIRKQQMTALKTK